MKRIFSEMKSLRYALLAFAATALLLGGCSGGGGSDYDAPEINQTPDGSAYVAPQLTVTAPLAGHTQNVLIDAAILKGWMDQGLVNKAFGSERVVLLSVSDATNYGAGHIPEAQLWSTSEQVMNRVEGPVESVNMVLTGAAMDEMLQKHAIDGNTTVVLTAHTGQSTFQVGRAYFLLRYWGFPKERIKVLDGFDSAWTGAGHALSTVVPAISRSTFSVCNLPQFRDDLRGGFQPGARLQDQHRLQPRLGELHPRIQRASQVVGDEAERDLGLGHKAPLSPLKRRTYSASRAAWSSYSG